MPKERTFYDPDVIARVYGLQVGASNARIVRVSCPVHFERTPSLVMWRESQTYLCHGCGSDGTLGRLVRLLDLDPPRPEAFLTPPEEQLSLFTFLDSADPHFQPY